MDGRLGFVAGVALGGNRLPSSTCPRTSAPGVIQMAHHPQKKGAKKHRKYRPKKHSLADKNRKKPEYNVNPLGAEGLPPIYELVSAAGGAPESAAEEEQLVAEEVAAPVAAASE